jgi:hypothetical protein
MENAWRKFDFLIREASELPRAPFQLRDWRIEVALSASDTRQLAMRRRATGP